MIDTAVTCPPLGAADAQRLRALMRTAERSIAPEARRKRAAYDEEQVDELVRAGASRDRAKRVVEKRRSGVLMPDDVLHLDDGSAIKVRLVLDNPDMYADATLADPIEGVEYGRNCAKVMVGADGWPFIFTFAHGGGSFQLRYDLNAVREKLAAASDDDVIDVLARLVPHADLEPIEVERLVQETKRRTGVGVRVIKAKIKEARDAAAARRAEAAEDDRGVESIDDFYAYLPTHEYIYLPTGDLWPAPSVDACVPPRDGVKASAWLDRNRAVVQMTWAPGEARVIADRLLVEGGWVDRPGAACFNLYRPPTIVPGDPKDVAPWYDHVRRIYPDDYEHVLDWFAHRVQRPGEKINHALVLGGDPGIGKDTIVEPVVRAVGPWNFAEVTPSQLMGPFTPFHRSIIVRVNEVRDLGDFTRQQFHEHCKMITATPPHTLPVNEKNKREYKVVNVVGLILTTNHKDDGIYLPADDRRTRFCWSEAKPTDFTTDYWDGLWKWFERGGFANVAAYLATRDISRFNPKATPTKTAAFEDVAAASRPPEANELQDIIDDMERPDVVTVIDIAHRFPNDELLKALKDRRNSRSISNWFRACGYVVVGNPDTDEHIWRIRDRRQAVYAKATLTLEQRVAAVRAYKRHMEPPADEPPTSDEERARAEELARMAREDSDAEYRARRATEEAHRRRPYNPGDDAS
jgi:hypothetical protein